MGLLKSLVALGFILTSYNTSAYAQTTIETCDTAQWILAIDRNEISKNDLFKVLDVLGRTYSLSKILINGDTFAISHLDVPDLLPDGDTQTNTALAELSPIHGVKLFCDVVSEPIGPQF